MFAAQADKAVVHVYSREKGNQEATVPFPERITCITLACDDSVLVLGTAEGRIFWWEIATGRQLTSAQSHMQTVTAVTVDPTSNFLLSASADSTVHIWSIPQLLSFASGGFEPPSPVRTFTSHNSEIVALALGHSSSFCNFAVSVSTDRTCYVWDYYTNTVLRTYLLSATPTSLALDAADRALYVGYDDSSIQQLDLYRPRDSKGGEIKALRSQDDARAPIQPLSSSRWSAPDATCGAVITLSVSFDGSNILSGDDSGSILVWDVARRGLATRLLQAPLPGPVTNLSFLDVQGFLNRPQPKVKTLSVVKPKLSAFDDTNGKIPENYNLNVEFVSTLSSSASIDFERELVAPVFTTDAVDTALCELLSWKNRSTTTEADAEEEDADFMALDDMLGKPRQLTLQEQNDSLKAELEALRRVQKASFDKINQINAERKALLQREQRHSSKRQKHDQNSVNGAHIRNVAYYSSSGEDD